MQLGAMHHHVIGVIPPFGPLSHWMQISDFGRVPLTVMRVVGDEAEAQDALFDAKTPCRFHAVRRQLEGRADARKAGRLLIDVRLDALAIQCRGCGKPADPRSDNGYREWWFRQSSPATEMKR